MWLDGFASDFVATTAVMDVLDLNGPIDPPCEICEHVGVCVIL